MRDLSAVDAVSPAIQRTRDFLFRPFRWGTFLKLGLVAMITEGFWGNLQSSSHGGSSSGHGQNIPSVPQMSALWPPSWIVVAVAAAAGAILLSCAIFYLITRLRFAFFHCLVRNTREIGPGWRLYRAQATRFFWLNVAVGLGFLLLVVLVLLPFAAGIWKMIRDTPAGGQPDIGLLLAVVLPLLPLILVLALAAISIDVILRDCMLPHFALENATAGEAWARVRARILAEKRQFFVYAVLRVVLPTIATAAVFMVLIIPGLILAGAAAAFGYGLHSAFADATGAAAMVGILVQAFFGVLAIGFVLLLSVCLGGPVSTGVREYALLFYGGRYKALGDLLDSPAA